MSVLKFNFVKISLIVSFALLSLFTINFYNGNKFILALFDLTSLFLVLNATLKRSNFFDIFIAFYLSMGFFLKFNTSIYLGGDYYKSLVQQGTTIENIDTALLVSSVSFAVTVLVSLLSHYIFGLFSHKKTIKLNLIKKQYLKYRLVIITSFVIVVFLINYTNYHFSIYTKGGISHYSFFTLNFYKYFISFGFTFFILNLFKIELFGKKKFPLFFTSIIFFENMASSISQISRAMVLTSLSIFVGIFKYCSLNKIRIGFATSLSIFLFIFLLFILSLYSVTKNRDANFIASNTSGLSNFTKQPVSEKDISILIDQWAKPMLIDRWVGIEGVIAVSSNPLLGVELFRSSLAEKNVRGLSFFDKNFIDSPYKEVDFTKKQFVTLPGYIAFFFYTGSFLYLIIFITLVTFFANLLEWFSLFISEQNYVISSFVSNLFCYRLINFGYMPLSTLQYIILILITLIFYNILFKYLEKKFK